MPNEDPTYTDSLNTLQRGILEFLRTLETLQEEILPGITAECQARLVAATRDTFRRFESDFAPLNPPAGAQEAHERLCAAIRDLAKANELFMTQPGREWTLAFLMSRNCFCRGLYGLYALRDALPLIAIHFLLDGATARVPAQPDGIARGFIQRQRNDDCSDYTLYIPEDYSPEKLLPLVVALHGGYGQGYEYVWTWLRPARSRRYAVLAPKSFGNTWDISLPSMDSRSILKMLDEVAREYSIDPARVYLTGLSDGGIFTYIFGLEQSHLFRGLAVIAGVLHLTLDPLLRRGQGKDTPIFVVHGVHDFIFPVTFARQTCNLLQSIGYNVTYNELPDWGHAYPYSINQRLVLPWLESLPFKST
jgi:phospholipase/carboxylesterase